MVEQTLVSGLELWQWQQQALKAAKTADVSPDELDWLLLEVANLDRLALRLESFKDWKQIRISLPLADLERFWQRRLHERLPVQYITGITPWRQFRIAVTSDVLIPRPETEQIIDLAAAATKNSPELQQGSWIDLGTGSGALALGLAATFTAATIYAVDYSPAALAVAAQNARNCGFADRIRFGQGSWWEALSVRGFSGMVSNPPYIPTGDLPGLQPEVLNHEPHLALDGGADGLDCIRHLVETSPNYLRSGGIWLIEMMLGQAETVTQLLQNQGSYRDIQIYQDFAGIDRFALAYRI